MSIRKRRTTDGTNKYLVTGREFMHLHCTMPSGDIVQISIGIGTIDVKGREYVSMDALFDPKSTVEMRQDVPQNAQIIIRLPKEA